MMAPFEGWDAVAGRLRTHAASPGPLNDGQRAALRAIADRLPGNGVLIADEVGMGKTRIATSLARVVAEAGGRVAVLIPPGLGFQWQREFRAVGQLSVPSILRSYWAYLEAWSDGLNAKPWFREPIVLASHGFMNWRLGVSRPQWRWEQLCVMRGIWKGSGQREGVDEWVFNAAQQICLHLKEQLSAPGGGEASRLVDHLFGHSPETDYDNASQYSAQGVLRERLERAICVGLGRFDLVIIDEAHKGRGEDSKLSLLLERLWLGSDNRRVGLTATPVELDSGQWIQTLSRLGVPEAERNGLQAVIERYRQSIDMLRSCWRTNATARDAYGAAAQDFEGGLSRYVLRRSKQSDKTVQAFADKTGEPHDAYRSLVEISIDVAQLTPQWRQAVCAAEALSFTALGNDDLPTKRLRLTIGNGHGIASRMDEGTRNNVADQKQTEVDEVNGKEFDSVSMPAPLGDPDKRMQRTHWWYERLQRAAKSDGGDGLFHHPAILAAAEMIEEAVGNDEKVLVFGRFTHPMQVLVELLNARAMLRARIAGAPWPQSKLPDGRDVDARVALRAAWRQLGNLDQLNEVDLQIWLSAQYATYEKAQKDLRAHIFERIKDGLRERDGREQALLEKVRHKDAEDTVLAPLTRALSEMMAGESIDDSAVCARAFRELVKTLQAADDPDHEPFDDQDSDRSIAFDPAQVEILWDQLKTLLGEEYGATRGGFARLMYGETKHETRRLLQAAFNRPQSNPKVLVAQSVVGREGLNLHEACRIVVLLHPEWNPGVVEQQIGRVDRMGSRWEGEMERFEGIPAHMPRIEIRPIVFSGTYDEHNWRVLQRRWDDLRAQLHGIVVPARERATATEEERGIICELDRCAPNFSPEQELLPENRTMT